MIIDNDDLKILLLQSTGVFSLKFHLLLIVRVIEGDLEQVILFAGYLKFSGFYPFGSSKLKCDRSTGVVSLLTVSIKVFPIQILLPPR